MSKALATYEEDLLKEVATIKQSIATPGIAKITTNNKRFTLPDGTSSTEPLNVIILDFVNANTYYEGVYNAKNIQSPTCRAIGKEVHENLAPDMPEPVSDTCANCPNNEWGSDPQGGRGKACKNSILLAVIPPTISEDNMVEPMVLSLPPTSIKAWATYVTRIAGEYGTPPVSLITRIEFDPNTTYPKFNFKAVGKHGKLEQVMPMRKAALNMLLAM